MRVVPFGLLFVLGWIALSLGRIWDTMGEFPLLEESFVAGTSGSGAQATGQYVGHNPTAGLVGVTVLLLTLLVGIYLYAEAGETTPVPEQFPPR